MLRRVVLLGETLLVGVIVLGGVALADDIRGTFGKDTLEGTNQLDRIYGLDAADTITGKGGSDDCYGGSGADVIRCGAGNDRVDGGFGEDELLNVAVAMTRSALRTVEWIKLTAVRAMTRSTSMSLT